MNLSENEFGGDLEAVLREAEQAISPDVKNPVFTLKLPFAVVRDFHLFVLQAERIFPKLSDHFADSVYGILSKKVEIAVGLDNHATTNKDEGDIIEIEFTERELDFYNKHPRHLLAGSPERKAVEQSSQNYSDQEICEYLKIAPETLKRINERQHNFDLIQMRIFMTLNSAWVAAGGAPRPEFIRFQKGEDSIK